MVKRGFLKVIDVVLKYLPSGVISSPKNDENKVLSPLLYFLLGFKRKTGSPSLCELTPEQGRIQYRKNVLPLAAKYKVKETIDFSIPFENRQLAVRHFIPQEKNSLPTLLIYLHGGGYVIGDLDTHDDICRLICRNTGTQVISVDYRLAPEHPYPAGIQDAEFIVKWVQDNAEKFSIKKNAVILGGDSAGATIATAVANKFAGTNNEVLAQLLIYPGTDKSTVQGSYEKFGYEYFLNLADRDWFYSHYINNDPLLVESTDISPLKHHFIVSPTPAIMVTAGFDVLRDEGYAYVNKIKASKGIVKHLHFGHLTHGFINLTGVHRDSKNASVQITAALRVMIKSLLNL